MQRLLDTSQERMMVSIAQIPFLSPNQPYSNDGDMCRYISYVALQKKIVNISTQHNMKINFHGREY